MFSLKVGQAEQYLDIAENETRIRVPFQSLDLVGEVAADRIESFPLLTSENEVRETLQRHLTVFIDEAEKAVESMARQEAHDHAQEVVDSISNINISV
jgi:hypothetical protein